MDIHIIMRTNQDTKALAQLRLMQLVSPSLPIGAFTYSQGLEYAVETGWVNDVDTLQDWLSGLLLDGMTYVEVPIIQRTYAAIEAKDDQALTYWNHYLLATRESREIRQEEKQRAQALTRLLPQLDVYYSDAMSEAMSTSQIAPYTLAAVTWGISLQDAAQGYVWSWLENQVAAAIKLVPLGQTQGQQVEYRLAEQVPPAIALGLSLDDDQIGASAPALGIASSLHETQYSRLFRS